MTLNQHKTTNLDTLKLFTLRDKESKSGSLSYCQTSRWFKASFWHKKVKLYDTDISFQTTQSRVRLLGAKLHVSWTILTFLPVLILAVLALPADRLSPEINVGTSCRLLTTRSQKHNMQDLLSKPESKAVTGKVSCCHQKKSAFILVRMTLLYESQPCSCAVYCGKAVVSLRRSRFGAFLDSKTVGNWTILNNV